MPPEYRSLVVPRHARIGVVGDQATATEAWLILHGYGMMAQGILHWFEAAERPGRVLVAPEGLSRFYQERNGIRTVGASWMTREDRDHELEDQQGYLDRVVEEVIGQIPRLEVHGFSQGVAVPRRRVPQSAAFVRALAGVFLAAGVRAAFQADLLALASGEGLAGGGLRARRGFAVGFGDDLVAHRVAP